MNTEQNDLLNIAKKSLESLPESGQIEVFNHLHSSTRAKIVSGALANMSDQDRRAILSAYPEVPATSTSSRELAMREFPRVTRESMLALNIGRQRVSWMALDKRGEFRDAGAQEGDLKDILAQMGPEWRSKTDNRWCSVSLNNRFVITLEVNLSRRAGLEQQLRTNPKSVLGAKAERGKRYSLLHNPESNTSVLLSCDEEAVNKTAAMLKEAGLFAGRICVGVYGMMLDLIEQVSEARRARAVFAPGEPFGSVVMVACNEGSVCALSQREEQWTELRSRTDLYADDMSPVLDIILPLIQNAGPNTNIVFMNDKAGCALPELLRQRLPGALVSEVTVPGQLWKLLADD